MAKVFIVKYPGSKVSVAYVVDQAVGQGCPNRRDDVLLVQFFLKVAMVDGPESPGYKPPGEKPIETDGICGRQTIAYIKFLQEESNRRNPGNKLSTDSRIDPVQSGTPVGTISNMLYTILALNVLYAGRRGQMHNNISQDPLFPKELTKCFFI